MNLNKIHPGNQEKINVFIVAAKGSKYYYRYDKEAETFFLERVLKNAFPFCFGFVPRTHHVDGKHIEIALLTTEPLEIGTVVSARPVGMVRMKAEIPDDVLIAVSITDHKLSYLNDVSNILKKNLNKIEDFLEEFKDKRFERSFNAVHAKRAVKHAIELYNQEFG